MEILISNVKDNLIITFLQYVRLKDYSHLMLKKKHRIQEVSFSNNQSMSHRVIHSTSRKIQFIIFMLYC